MQDNTRPDICTHHPMFTSYVFFLTQGMMNSLIYFKYILSSIFYHNQYHLVLCTLQKENK